MIYVNLIASLCGKPGEIIYSKSQIAMNRIKIYPEYVKIKDKINKLGYEIDINEKYPNNTENSSIITIHKL